MKTREEVEALKAQWLKDPNWDLAGTGGFDEYAIELAGFEAEHWAICKAAREKVDAIAYRNTPASEATLRDMFAARAMGGELASQNENEEWPVRMYPALAERCYKIADAMMAERKAVPHA